MTEHAPLLKRSGARERPEARAAVHPAALYYAFLSYSHADEETADWLHRQLERFRTPRSVAGRLTEIGVVPKQA